MKQFFAGLLVLGLASASVAADEPAHFSMGDTVRVEWDGQVLIGTVMGEARPGWWRVKVKSYGTELMPVFATERLQLVKRHGTAASKNTPHQKSEATLSTGENLNVSNADWSVVNNVYLGETAAWSLKADPVGAAAGEQALTSRAVILASAVQSKDKEPLGSSQSVGSLLLAPASLLAFVVTTEADRELIPKYRVQRVDLVKGLATQPISLPIPMRPIDVDPTGQRILVASDSQVGVWEFKAQTLQMVRTWRPGLAANAGLPPQPGERPPRRGRSSRRPTLFARFVDANHVLTTASAQLVMWEVSTSRAIYKIPVPMAAVTLSPGHKSFVTSLEDGLYAFDALTGKAQGKLQGEAMRPSCLAFHPDGHRLAGVDPQRLIVWNFDSGRQECVVSPSSGFSSLSNMDWVSADDLLVGGRDLVDLNRRLVLWRYQLADSPSRDAKSYGQLGRSFWYLATNRDRDERGLFPVVLPHEAARRKAASLNQGAAAVARGVYGASKLTATGIENVPAPIRADDDASPITR